MNTRANRILWAALMVSLIVYVGMAAVTDLPPSDLPIDLLAGILALVAVAEGVGSLVYRKIALSGPIQSGDLDPRTPHGFQRAYTPFLLGLVLSQSVGIYGLLLSLLSGEILYALVFNGAALILTFLHRPTAPDLAPPVSLRQRGEDPTPFV